MYVPKQTTIAAALDAVGAKAADLHVVIDGARYADEGAVTRLFGDAAAGRSVFDGDYPQAIQAAADGNKLLGFTNMRAMDVAARNKILTNVASGGFADTTQRPPLWVDAIADNDVKVVLGW